MNIIDRAIQEGVEEGMAIGYQNAAAKGCDGYNEPEDRCPMRPPHCACLCVRYRALPWWQKIFRKEPPAPTNDECLEVMVGRVIEETILEQAA